MSLTLSIPWMPYHRQPDQSPGYPLQTNQPCPGCNSDNEEELVRVDRFQCFEDRDGLNRINVRVVFCLNCGWIYSNPWLTPKAIPFLFDRAGWSYGHCDPAERVAWVRERVPSARRILDVGCGDGSFLAGFPESCQRAGVDLDARAIERGKKLFPHIRFFLADFNDWEWPKEAEVVTLFHLLEHVPDPMALLTTLRNSVTHETRLIAEVPVLDRAIECQGPDLSGFFSIPHRTHFSRATFNDLLQRAGWRITDTLDHEGNGYRVLAEPGVVGNQKSIDISEQRQLAKNYCEVRESAIETVREKVASLSDDCEVLIWGAGHHTEFLDRLTSLFTAKRKFLIVDGDPEKTGTTLHGIPVVHADSLPPEIWSEEKFSVLVSSYAWQSAIVEGLTHRGVARDRILTLYPSRP